MGLRVYILLTVLAVLIAFATGILLFGGIRAPEWGVVTMERAQSRVSEYVRTHRDLPRASLAGLFAPGGYPELFDPATAFLQTSYPYAVLSDLERFTRDCVPGRVPSDADQLIKKAYLWQSHACGIEKNLPDEFFVTPPYMHPFGMSFAQLRLERDRDTDLAAAHAGYFHVGEGAGGRSGNGGILRDALEKASSNALTALLKQPLMAVSGEILFLKSASPDAYETDASRPDEYVVTKVADFTAFTRRFGDAIFLREGVLDKDCPLRLGNVCWVLDPDAPVAVFKRYSFLFFASAVVLLILVLWIFLQKIRQDKSEQMRKIFALRTLAHELRTPVTGLALHVETLRGEFDAFSEAGQDAFMRISGDVARLRRLIEASRQYLNAFSGNCLICLAPQTLPSVSEWVHSVVEPYEAVTLSFSGEDGSFRIDSHWLGICLKNLIENALQHGVSPVSVSVIRRDAVLELHVEDNGSLAGKKLGELTAAFAKGAGSQGLGIGLSLVQSIVLEMGGEFSLQYCPSRFSIVVREVA